MSVKPPYTSKGNRGKRLARGGVNKDKQLSLSANVNSVIVTKPQKAYGPGEGEPTTKELGCVLG